MNEILAAVCKEKGHHFSNLDVEGVCVFCGHIEPSRVITVIPRPLPTVELDDLEWDA